MKVLLVLAGLGILSGAFAAAITIEEFAALRPDEKVTVLRAKPEQFLTDQAQLLRLYTTSLRDPANSVQQAGAHASVFLMLGLQAAKERGLRLSFSREDSDAYQQALVAMLDHVDVGIRSAVSMALAYSAPPNQAIENLLIERLGQESDERVKAAILRSMGQAGYRSDRFVAAVLELFHPDVDASAIHTAAQVLAAVQPIAAVDMLIGLAANESPAQRHALQALAAYGEKAAAVNPVLEKLITDPRIAEDIRNLGRIALDAISRNQGIPSGLQELNLVDLWPVAVAVGNPRAGPSRQTSKAGSEFPTMALSMPPVPAPAIIGPQTAEDDWRYIWVLGIAISAVLLLTVIACKRRGRRYSGRNRMPSA